ncbi:MAG: ABC transporter permease [Tannerella sp.]|nr:ABC transporter permease [Tannerella sp.]
MKQLFYTIRYLLRVRDGNLIKILSLTLGLSVALVLFTKVAYEMSFDKQIPDSDRVYRIQRKIYTENKVDNETERLYAPVAGDLKSDIEGIEVATAMILGVSKGYLQYGETWIEERILEAETSFLDLYGIKLTEGNKQYLNAESNLFLSEAAAQRFFGKESATGKTLIKGAKTYTVAGVFKNMPASHLDFDVLLPMGKTELGWHNPDCFAGYVKLKPGVSAEEIEAKIPLILPKYMNVEAMAKQGNIQEFYLMPVTKIHSGQAKVRRLVVILSLLAFSLLFVAAMNYVLISVSSLAKRAKSVGIHKCNGASNAKIFQMFIYETVITSLIALVFSSLLIFAFKGVIESIIQTPLAAIFSRHNLWVTGAVLSGLLLLAGVIPAIIFSAVPVTHLFRAYSTDKRNWKRSLLFVQFSGVAFVATMLLIIVKQYNLLLYNDLGYTTKNIVYTENIFSLSRDEVERIKVEFERLPEVVSASISSFLPTDRMEGVKAVSNDHEELFFSSRATGVDADFLETMQMKLLIGSNVGVSSDNYTRAVVNEAFVRKMGWNGSPIGRTFKAEGLNENDRLTEVIGVVKDFKMNNLYKSDLNAQEAVAPLMIFPLEKDKGMFRWSRVVLRLHSVSSDVLAALDEKLQQITGRPNTYFTGYQSRIQFLYHETLLYRDAVIVASIILFIITILGLVGFTDDEVNRRSKEIGIRKIFGATGRDVLIMISKGIVYIAVPTILIGLMFSFVVGSDWLQQFAEKISLNAYLFALSGISILSGIILCITTRAWTVANENPVNSIKME